MSTTWSSPSDVPPEGEPAEGIRQSRCHRLTSTEWSRLGRFQILNGRFLPLSQPADRFLVVQRDQLLGDETMADEILALFSLYYRGEIVSLKCDRDTFIATVQSHSGRSRTILYFYQAADVAGLSLRDLVGLLCLRADETARARIRSA